jgi:hypothetical protein
MLILFKIFIAYMFQNTEVYRINKKTHVFLMTKIRENRKRHIRFNPNGLATQQKYV